MAGLLRLDETALISTWEHQTCPREKEAMSPLLPTPHELHATGEKGAEMRRAKSYWVCEMYMLDLHWMCHSEK